MPKSELPTSRPSDARAEYSFRRQLGLNELVPAIGVGIGVGVLAFYIVRLMLQRTPLRVQQNPRLAMKRDGGSIRGSRGERPRLGHPAA